MRERREKLGTFAAVKGTMLEAHLGWARERLGDLDALTPHLAASEAALVARPLLAVDWYLLSTMVAIDKAIAGAVGGDPERVYRELGHNSAVINLAGAYKAFITDEPHRFFASQARLHARFLNFGQEVYSPGPAHDGQIRLTGYPEYSPVFCCSAAGYYEGALEMMKVPGPVRVQETACQCAGDDACVFALAWA